MDASYYQLGSLIIQYGKPIAFYIHKLNGTQIWYTVMEKEFLGTVKTLKEFFTIVFGQQFKIFTDQKYIAFKNFNSDSSLRWKLILE